MSACASTALAEMRQGDPEQAAAAEMAWRRVDGTEDAGLLSQWRVQSFCWLELPADRTVGSPWRIAVALADLLERMSFTRYADIARGEETRAVLAGAARSEVGFRSQARGALERSGIQPPDTAMLSWAHRCGPGEANAYVKVADALELAVTVGDYVPGRSRWRKRREEITNRVLATARPELDGRAPYEGIVAERVLAWTRSSGSRTRERLLTGLGTRLAQAVPAPDPATAERVLGRVKRFLTVVEEDAPLTASGYLKPDAVARCVDAVGLAGEVIGSSRRERDVTAVFMLRNAVQRLGLIRRYAGKFVLTPAGRSAAADSTALWQEVATALVREPGPAASGGAQASVVVWDILLAALLDDDDGAWQSDDVVDACLAVLEESGWRMADGRPLDPTTVHELVMSNFRDVFWMGLLRRQDGPSGRSGLVPAQDATSLFLAALRHRLLHSRMLVQEART